MPNPIETLIAKGAGKVGAIEAVAHGLKGVFVKLAEQHHEAAVLLSRAASTADFEKRRELWGEIKKQLVSHERAELTEVYPAIEAHPATRDIVQRHADEASELEKTIMQIDAMSFDSLLWSTSIERLTTLVKQHAAEEEGDFFKRAQEALGEERAKQLEQPFKRAQDREMSAIAIHEGSH